MKLRPNALPETQRTEARSTFTDGDLVGKDNDDLNVESFRHIDVGLGSTARRRNVCDCALAFDLNGKKPQDATQLHEACFSDLSFFPCTHGCGLSFLEVACDQ